MLARERGSVTAEFAVAVPAVVLVLACCLTAVQGGMTALRLGDAAAGAARIIARGDSRASAQSYLVALVPGSAMSISVKSGMVCVRTSAAAGSGVLAAWRVTGSSCALGEG